MYPEITKKIFLIAISGGINRKLLHHKKGNYPKVIKYHKHKPGESKKNECVIIIKIFMETNNISLL